MNWWMKQLFNRHLHVRSLFRNVFKVSVPCIAAHNTLHIAHYFV